MHIDTDRLIKALIGEKATSYFKSKQQHDLDDLDLVDMIKI